MQDRNRWIKLIKELMIARHLSQLEAERIALADPQWRRWVERQINNDMRCRRMALSHIRDNERAALIERQGETLKVR